MIGSYLYTKTPAAIEHKKDWHIVRNAKNPDEYGVWKYFSNKLILETKPAEKMLACWSQHYPTSQRP